MRRVALAAAALAVMLLAGDLQAQQPVGSAASAVAGVDARIDACTAAINTCQPVASGNHRSPYRRGRSWRRLEGRYSADGSWSGQPWGWESSYGYTSLAGYGWRWDHTVAGRTGRCN